MKSIANRQKEEYNPQQKTRIEARIVTPEYTHPKQILPSPECCIGAIGVVGFVLTMRTVCTFASGLDWFKARLRDLTPH